MYSGHFCCLQIRRPTHLERLFPSISLKFPGHFSGSAWQNQGIPLAFSLYFGYPSFSFISFVSDMSPCHCHPVSPNCPCLDSCSRLAASDLALRPAPPLCRPDGFPKGKADASSQLNIPSCHPSPPRCFQRTCSQDCQNSELSRKARNLEFYVNSHILFCLFIFRVFTMDTF